MYASVKSNADIIIGPADDNDLARCVRICNNVWKGIFQGSIDMLKKRTQAFQQGGIVVGKVNGKVEGYISFQQIHSPKISGNWNSVTDFGNMTLSHQNDGEWVMGIGLAVSQAGSQNGLPQNLMLYIAEYVIRERKKGAVLVSRLSGFCHYKDKISPQEYAKLEKQARPIDPCLRFFSQFGFSIPDNPIIIDDYVDGGGDPNSCGHSIYIVKRNPYAWLPKPFAYVLSKLIYLLVHIDRWRMK